MKKKTIVALIGKEGVGKTTACKVFGKEGFHKISLMAKVIEVASYLFTDEELESDDGSLLRRVKQRGNATYSGYWLNLALMSVPEKKELIVIDDIEEEDFKSCSIIQSVEIVKTKETEETEGLNPNKIIIENEGNLKEFKDRIKTLARKLTSK